MAHRYWIAALLAIILLFGLMNVGIAQSSVLNEQVEQELQELKELEKTFVHTVEVQPGDTVYEIAKKFGVSVQTISLVNELPDPSVIHVGDKLRIPQAKGFYYEIKKGDTLEAIAKEYGVSEETIKEMNPLLDEGTLAKGETIFLKEPEQWPQTQNKSGVQLASRSSGKSEAASAKSSQTYMGEFTLTAYTAGPESTGKSPGDPGYGITASGAEVQTGVTIAADPRVIPMGTKVFIEGVGTRVVQDIGGAIKGNRIDVYIPDLVKARQFGVKKGIDVFIVE